MSQIAGLKDLRGHGPPADIGTFLFPSTAVAFSYTFSGTTYYAAIRVGISGWNLLDCGIVPETVVNNAFTTLGAGARVILIDNTFTLSAAGIAFSANNQTLEGQGRSSFIDGDALATTVHAINLSGYTDCSVKNLSVQTEDGGGKTCHCVFIEDGADRFLVENVTIVDSDDDGIHIEGTTITTGWILACRILDTDGDGIFSDMDALNNLDYLDIGMNDINSTGGDGMLLTDIRYSQIYRNLVRSSGGDGIEINLATEVTITDNRVNSNVGMGVYLVDSPFCIISDNETSFNDTGETGNFDGIHTDADSTECIINGNFVHSNYSNGISNNGIRAVITGNISRFNYYNGIDSSSICLIANNFVYHNSVGSADARDGIVLLGGGDDSNSLIIGNFCSDDGTTQRNGIYLETSGTDECLIIGNLCLNNVNGIVLVGDNDSNLIVGNYLVDNGTYGIDIAAATASNNTVKNNYFQNNGTRIRDNGVGTRMHARQVQFVLAGGGSAGETAPVINTSPGGIDIDGNDEFAYCRIILPEELQEVIRIKIFGYSNVIEATNNMLLRLVAHGAASSQAWTQESIDVANHPSEETGGIVANDVIHWVYDEGDDEDIGDIRGGDLVEVMAVGEPGSAPDVATDALIECVEFEYV